MGAIGAKHLARNHLKMARLLAMPTADITAIKPHHDGLGWQRRSLRQHLGGMRRYDILAYPHRPVAHRAGVHRSADWQQLRQ